MNFDQQFNRRQTNSFKWAVGENELPMSTADMDFQTAPAIIQNWREYSHFKCCPVREY